MDVQDIKAAVEIEVEIQAQFVIIVHNKEMPTMHDNAITLDQVKLKHTLNILILFIQFQVLFPINCNLTEFERDYHGDTSSSNDFHNWGTREPTG